MPAEVNEQGDLINIKSIEEQLDELGRKITGQSYGFTIKYLDPEKWGLPTKEELEIQKGLVKQHNILKGIHNSMKKTNKSYNVTKNDLEDILREVMESKSSVGEVVRKLR